MKVSYEDQKTDLLAQIQDSRALLESIISGLTSEQMLTSGVCRKWSIKDLLAHLTAWEGRFMDWYQAGLHGETQPPAVDSTAMDQYNQHIYEINRDRSLDDVLIESNASYQNIYKTVIGIPAEDLFTPRRFAWTGKYKLSTYVSANTCHHYSWATYHIKRWQEKKCQGFARNKS